MVQKIENFSGIFVPEIQPSTPLREKEKLLRTLSKFCKKKS